MRYEEMKYPIGVQSFEELRTAGMCYVDKTSLLFDIVQNVNYGFLSRPRRFGKSLLLSTMEAYFEGKKELFEGLAIMKLEKNWIKYPVIHLDLNAAQYRKPEDLHGMLDVKLTSFEKRFGREPQEKTPSDRFAGIIRRAYEQTGLKVVILIDEYDKPMALNLGNEKLQEEYRSILKAFYGVMKSCDQYIRFGFLTGVTKFSKVSVFSDLNNIDDISMWNKYATICGLTKDEICRYFDDEVESLAQANKLSKKDCYGKLRQRYDGYHFCHDCEGVYNPYSLLHTLSKKSFGDYWFETGTPTQLITLLKQTDYNLNELTDGAVSSELLGSIDSIRENPISVLYQAGYLTIKNYNKEFDEYTLDFPNKEVENGFIKYLLPIYTNANRSLSQFAISKFVSEVREGYPEAFMKRLSAMMADTDYRILGDAELYFHNFIFTFFRLLGLYVDVERATSSGRADMIIETNSYIYILEFKLDKTAEEALAQIENKNYALPYAADTRKMFKIGINFSSKKRCIDKWIVRGEEDG